jgi:6-pyruvoyl-tetrahydropterin synthase
MRTVPEVGRGEFDFSAAHSRLHGGKFESLHGHTFQVALRLSGEVDNTGTLVDFGQIKQALRKAIAPLRCRTLMPGFAPEMKMVRESDMLSIALGGKSYVPPADDVVVLPLVNTTTEAIVGYLLGEVLAHLSREVLAAAELEVSESPSKSAIACLDFAC